MSHSSIRGSEDCIANAWFIVLLTGYDTASLRLFYLIFIFFYRVIFQNYYVLDEMERMDLSLLRYIYDLIGLRSK